MYVTIISTIMILSLIILGVVYRVVNSGRESREGKLIDMKVYSLLMLCVSVIITVYYVYAEFYGTKSILSYVILANGVLGIATSLVYYFGEIGKSKS